MILISFDEFMLANRPNAAPRDRMVFSPENMFCKCRNGIIDDYERRRSRQHTSIRESVFFGGFPAQAAMRCQFLILKNVVCLLILQVILQCNIKQSLKNPEPYCSHVTSLPMDWQSGRRNKKHWHNFLDLFKSIHQKKSLYV